MTHNYQLFHRDPTSFVIPNDGVAVVGAPHTPEQWNVLRYELESFVCEGEYREGLERILRTYLGHLDRDVQPAVWVSGFYGSGKSHLARVLEYLWRDVEFPDGARARGLVHLPGELNALFRELTTASRRLGGLWSAAGTLGSGAASVRLTLLAILFESAGLPTQYAQARFVLWLQQQGLETPLKEYVHSHGRDWTKELNNLYVSPVLHTGLVHVEPALGATPAELSRLLLAQFPNVTEITDAQFLETMQAVLDLQSDSPPKRPCTLLVLDELQQFIGDSPDRTLQVQNIVQACSARFGSALLFVATGQAALEATTQLSKLQDRFTVRVTLEDKDVVRVVREVILRKRPDQTQALHTVLDTAAGEIDRHLVGTRIAPTAADKAMLIPDYPLLPSRRRFWERALRAIDAAGTAGQLRNQLRITHAAVQTVARAPLGHVIPADFLYEQQESVMLQRKVLLPEVATTIQEFRDGSEDGNLRARLCATLFLIDQLPTSGILATGLRANADTLADLLVSDLTAGSSALRAKIPTLLQGLVEQGTLMAVDGEYRMQTREGAEWERDFRTRLARIRADDARIAGDRLAAFQKAVNAELKNIQLLQGVSKTPRKIELAFGLEVPPSTSAAVPVWVRDEWTVSEKTVREEAQAAGVESPIVFVLLRRQEADALRSALATHAAAAETLQARPANPGTPEGEVARRAMETRERTEKSRLDGIVAGIVANARIYQGGGNEVAANTFAESVQSALTAALVRLFPNFAAADHANWGNVVRQAGQGSPDALAVVGYPGDPAQHAVCRELRAFIGAHKRGSEILAQFRGPGYGWPDDAIAGALMTLMVANMVTAQKNHQPVSVRALAQSQIGVTEFFGEEHPPSATQRIQVRALLAEWGIPCKTGEETTAVSAALQHLVDLADQIGGDPPSPPVPDVSEIQAIRNRSGNAQLVGFHDARERLNAWRKEWLQAKARKADRVPQWARLQRLLTHADGLVAAYAVRSQVDAILAHRALLDDPDPVKPLLDELVNGLRNALQAKRQHLVALRDREVDALSQTDEWQKLTDEQWRGLFAKHHLGPVPEPHMATDDALLASLDEMPLSAWENLAEALPTRIQAAREDAVKLLEPQAVRVKPKSATLRTAAEVDAYLDELRTEILAHIASDKPVLL